MRDDAIGNARLLIVDDQEANVFLLEALLQRFGYTNLKSTTDPRQALSLFSEFQPDLILLDLMMPHLDGFQVMDLLQPLIPESAYLPILVLTADVTLSTRQRALAAGARDFLTKPFDPTEVMLRIKNLLFARVLHREIQQHNLALEDRVRERTRELEESHIEVLERLALAAEFRDDETGQHTRRVGDVAARVAGRLGFAAPQVELIVRAAPLHDVGKIGIPDQILLKPGRLDPDEFEVMKTHTTIGARILSSGRFNLLQMAEAIALSHHERWDGAGYPRGMKGEEIPIEARIVAAADAFDAMCHERVYRAALSPEEVWEVLWEGADRQWDEKVVEALDAVAGLRAGAGETDA